MAALSSYLMNESFGKGDEGVRKPLKGLALATLVLLIPMSVLAGCTVASKTAPGTAAPSGGAAQPAGAARSGDVPLPADLAVLPTDPALNPRVTPPAPSVTVASDLPFVEAPPGMVSQQESVQKAVAAAHYPMPVVLTRLDFDTANGMWMAHFSTGGRVAMAPASHPAPARVSDDPAEQRKDEYSWYSIASEVTLALDGRTGEVRGGGFSGGAPGLSRTDLEHYRGRILTGGEEVVLRLINQDGSPEGRDLMVDVPNGALTNGLALWQLTYGMGRVLDVWGLTGPEGRVAAYRLSLPHPPDEALLANRLVASVPVYRGAYDQPDQASRRLLLAQGATVSQVAAWYKASMPAYGWGPASPAGAAPESARFRSSMGILLQLDFSQLGSDVQIQLTWPQYSSGAP